MAWNPIGNGASGNQRTPFGTSANACSQEQAEQWANQLFDFYHAQELSANPAVFLAGVIDLFMHYPAPVVAKAASPVWGIPSKHKFPPRISEIRDWLEAEMMPVYRQLEREAIAEERARSLPPPVDRSQRLSYDELKAKYGDSWGLAPLSKKIKQPWPDVRSMVSAEEWAKIPDAK